jgi:hypothetical protein
MYTPPLFLKNYSNYEPKTIEVQKIEEEVGDTVESIVDRVMDVKQVVTSSLSVQLIATNCGCVVNSLVQNTSHLSYPFLPSKNINRQYDTRLHNRYHQDCFFRSLDNLISDDFSVFYDFIAKNLGDSIVWTEMIIKHIKQKPWIKNVYLNNKWKDLIKNIKELDGINIEYGMFYRRRRLEGYVITILWC